MPTYEYRCPKCEIVVERTLKITQFGTLQTCEDCSTVLEHQVPDGVGMVLKGDGWVGKNLRVRGQMSQKNQRLAQKSTERFREAPGMKLVPNVDGERVESWAEAKAFAASKGKNASSYDALVNSEKG